MNSLIRVDEYLRARRQFVISVWGEAKTGKSAFILTCPRPIFLLSFEPDGPYWALKNALDANIIGPDDVYIDEVIKNALGDSPPIQRTVDEDKAIYNHVQQQINYILKNEGRGTLGIDTGTTYWNITEIVEMDDITSKRKRQGQELFTFDWRYANAAMKKTMDTIRSGRLHCVITGHASPKYNLKGQRLNTWEYQGNHQLPRWVDIHMRLRYDQEYDEKGPRHWAVVEACRLDLTKKGIEIDNPTFDTVIDRLLK